jgi:hypothetical protein
VGLFKVPADWRGVVDDVEVGDQPVLSQLGDVDDCEWSRRTVGEHPAEVEPERNRLPVVAEDAPEREFDSAVSAKSVG